MSAYKRYNCTFTDRDILLEALKILGLKAVEHKTPQPLIGFEGKAREQKADIIVSKESLDENFTSCSNDLGFAWNPAQNSFDMIVSDYDAGKKVPERIRQAYAKIALERLMEEHRFTIEECTDSSELAQRTRIDVNIVASTIM